MSSKTYDWNKKATLYTVVKESGYEGDTIVSKRNSCPSNKVAQNKFVIRHSLSHGDVVNFVDYRYLGAAIVVYDEVTAKYSLVKNPDEGGGGHLTIPTEVLLNVDDATVKYEDILKEVPLFNLHMSYKDKFLKVKFNVDIPDEYIFDLWYQYGEQSDLYISKKSCETRQRFDINKTSWDEVVAFFDGTSLEQATFYIDVHLEGKEEVDEYDKKYLNEDTDMYAQPNLPLTWRARGTGTSSGGENSRRWRWKFTGPAVEEKKAREDAKSHLLGFSYTFID